MEPEQSNLPVAEPQPQPISAEPAPAPQPTPVSQPAPAPQPTQALAPEPAPAAPAPVSTTEQPVPKAKSKVTAGLLGIFLGAIGAHNWYLGEKAKGIAHVCMFFSSVPSIAVISFVLPNTRTLSATMQTEAVFDVLSTFFALIVIASAIWGLIEGIMILAKRQ